MPSHTPTLHMLCGKVASGKSSLAARLGAQPGTVVLSEDDWLQALSGDDMSSLQDFVLFSARLRTAVGPHVIALLQAGLSVVLDFQANTVTSRGWMRDLADEAKVAHRLHVLDAPNDVCLARLRRRNAGGAHPFAVTEAQFHQVTRHFVLPTADEGLDVVLHPVEA